MINNLGYANGSLPRKASFLRRKREFIGEKIRHNKLCGRKLRAERPPEEEIGGESEKTEKSLKKFRKNA